MAAQKWLYYYVHGNDTCGGGVAYYGDSCVPEAGKFRAGGLWAVEVSWAEESFMPDA